MVKTLNDNYSKNIDILKENLKRGLEPSRAINLIQSWRNQFIRHNLYGDAEHDFINKALEVVNGYTGLTVAEI